MDDNAIIAFYAELSCLKPGERVLRNTLLDRFSIPRRRGVRETTAAFAPGTTDPLVLYLQSLGVFTGVDEAGRAYFGRKEAAG
jgi:hypothetical protein